MRFSLARNDNVPYHNDGGEGKMTMKAFSDHIIAVARKNNLSITNLQLQKVMYFSLQTALVQEIIDTDFLNAMYNEQFQVWRYGPVVKSIYEEYKVYGSDSITKAGNIAPQLSPLDATIISYLTANPFELVKKSHSEKFWLDHQNQIDGWRSDVGYSLEDIKMGIEH